ncbi:hypothetical protein AKG11_24775 [Shinella sp. SUS2]|nr:hypothetical protein AKG11_24775 [Shinella sp. SUS2]KOC73207.1 hypothetical protein AKG10_23945 [Shinella sp. GWS1]
MSHAVSAIVLSNGGVTITFAPNVPLCADMTAEHDLSKMLLPMRMPGERFLIVPACRSRDCRIRGWGGQCNPCGMRAGLLPASASAKSLTRKAFNDIGTLQVAL